MIGRPSVLGTGLFETRLNPSIIQLPFQSNDKRTSFNKQATPKHGANQSQRASLTPSMMAPSLFNKSRTSVKRKQISIKEEPTDDVENEKISLRDVSNRNRLTFEIDGCTPNKRIKFEFD